MSKLGKTPTFKAYVPTIVRFLYWERQITRHYARNWRVLLVRYFEYAGILCPPFWLMNFSDLHRVPDIKEGWAMASFLVWCILFVLCWPLALLALVLYPILWLLLFPFRIIGITIHGVFALITAVILLPARLLGVPFRLHRAA